MGYSSVFISKNNLLDWRKPRTMDNERERGKGENSVLGNDVKEPFREPQTDSTLCLAGREVETIVILATPSASLCRSVYAITASNECSTGNKLMEFDVQNN